MSKVLLVDTFTHWFQFMKLSIKTRQLNYWNSEIRGDVESGKATGLTILISGHQNCSSNLNLKIKTMASFILVYKTTWQTLKEQVLVSTMILTNTDILLYCTTLLTIISQLPSFLSNCTTRCNCQKRFSLSVASSKVIAFKQIETSLVLIDSCQANLVLC